MTLSLRSRTLAVVLFGLAAATALSLPGRPNAKAADEKTPNPKGVDQAAVERTRATVRMLDNLHKSYVIEITKTYVSAKEKTPAATVLKRVFAFMEKTNDGSGRLIDATGSPLREGNVAKTEFEKKAVTAIKGGKPYIDEVATKDGKPVLRAATVVPAVMDACVNCHPNVKKNDVLGALVYEIPIR